MNDQEFIRIAKHYETLPRDMVVWRALQALREIAWGGPEAYLPPQTAEDCAACALEEIAEAHPDLVTLEYSGDPLPVDPGSFMELAEFIEAKTDSQS